MIFWIEIEHQRSEASETIFGVVKNLSYRRFQAEIAPVRVQTRVVGEALRVSSKIDLVVGLIEVSDGGHEFGFVVSLEAAPWDDIKNTVGAVTVIQPQ